MELELVGGPLDGTKTTLVIDELKPYIILPATPNNGQDIIYCCYKFEGSKLIFQSSKTKEEMMKCRR